jgi:D-aminopeptidase
MSTARRAMAEPADSKAAFRGGSGDTAMAFRPHGGLRRMPFRGAAQAMIADWPNDRTSPLFVAAAEAVEEAVLNALTMATTIIGRDGRTGRRARGRRSTPRCAAGDARARQPDARRAGPSPGGR